MTEEYRGKNLCATSVEILQKLTSAFVLAMYPSLVVAVIIHVMPVLSCRYMDLIDGYTAEGEEQPNGYITLNEWQEYFRYVAEDDTRDPETSPAACKVGG